MATAARKHRPNAFPEARLVKFDSLAPLMRGELCGLTRLAAAKGQGNSDGLEDNEDVEE